MLCLSEGGVAACWGGFLLGRRRAAGLSANQMLMDTLLHRHTNSCCRYPHVYATLCTSEAAAKGARSVNNSNVLCLGGGLTAPDEAAR